MAGTLITSTLSDGTNSTSSTNCILGSAKAWVNFAGSTGTIAGSFNVSSITRNATGDYTVNFTTSMPNTTYATTSGFSGVSGQNGIVFYPATQFTGVQYNAAYITTSSIRGVAVSGGGSAQDIAYMCISVQSS
jgi:hypothetical protein